METQINSILLRHKEGTLTTEQARLQLLVLFGVRNTSLCKLDRLPKNCSIIQCTKFKTCDGCGHQLK